MTDNELLQQILAKVNKIDELEESVNAIKEGQASIVSRVDKMESKIDKMETDIRETKTELRETRVLVESMPHHIKIIAEQHGIIIEKLDALADYPVTRERVATLEGGLKMVADRVKKLEAV